ncbi:uncharacterized protein Tco_0571737 [Tanacetum coccineum]
MYLHLSQSPSTTPLSTQTIHPPKFTHPLHPLFSTRRPSSITSSSSYLSNSLVRNVVVNADVTNKNKPTTSFNGNSDEQSVTFVSQENVPLEGVIQFEKPDNTSRFKKWGHVALLSGGDVLAILLFSAIGRFSHGFSFFDAETLRTADPFIAGDPRQLAHRIRTLDAQPLHKAIGGGAFGAFDERFLTPHVFMGWRALISNILADDKSKKNDVYKRGSPFELFEAWHGGMVKPHALGAMAKP